MPDPVLALGTLLIQAIKWTNILTAFAQLLLLSQRLWCGHEYLEYSPASHIQEKLSPLPTSLQDSRMRRTSSRGTRRKATNPVDGHASVYARGPLFVWNAAPLLFEDGPP